MTDTEKSPLDEAQSARVAALRIARQVLATKTGLTSGELGEFGTNELAEVADYIITGANPLNRYDDEHHVTVSEDTTLASIDGRNYVRRDLAVGVRFTPEGEFDGYDIEAMREFVFANAVPADDTPGRQ